MKQFNVIKPEDRTIAISMQNEYLQKLKEQIDSVKSSLVK
jgi:hypothetical protein